MAHKIRTLVLSHGMSLTGAPQTALNALEGMKKRMSFCIVSVETGPLEERYRKLGPTVALHKGFPGPMVSPADSVFAKARNMLYPVLRRRLMTALWSRWFKVWKPDVIYVNTTAALPISKMMALPDAPMLLHVKELDSVLAYADNTVPGVLQSRPQHYLAVSDAVRLRLMERYDIPSEKITVVNAYVPAKKFDSYLETRRTRIKGAPSEAPFVVGGAGTTDWRKGTLLWLQMAAELKERLGEANVRFVWVGVGGAEWDWQFRQMAKLMELEPLIEFVPSTKDPLSHFTRFDAFAMTSWEDPCPVVVIESMMLEIPVVCFDNSGGAPEEVADTGIVIPDFSSRLMAEAMERLAREPDAAQKMGCAARERALGRLTDVQQVPKIQREIERLAKQGRAA